MLDEVLGILQYSLRLRAGSSLGVEQVTQGFPQCSLGRVSALASRLEQRAARHCWAAGVWDEERSWVLARARRELNFDSAAPKEAESMVGLLWKSRLCIKRLLQCAPFFLPSLTLCSRGDEQQPGSWHAPGQGCSILSLIQDRSVVPSSS